MPNSLNYCSINPKRTTTKNDDEWTSEKEPTGTVLRTGNDRRRLEIDHHTLSNWKRLVRLYCLFVMLAPRKKLWSTPSNVLDVVCQWVQLKPGDVFCDIGCGDGRVLLHLATHWTTLHPESNTETISFLGLDINQDRIEEANAALESAREQRRVNPHLKIEFKCANAMEAVDLYQDATHFFLYLIPRGLKIFEPMLMEVLKKRRQQQCANNKNTESNDYITVLTYMSPLPGEKFEKKESCHVEHQPGAAWPVYLYNLRYFEEEEVEKT